MKIAIVEDDINMRKSLELSFSEHDEFDITTFRNPKDALKDIDSSFNLVITDLNMPHMHGLEFLKKLKEQANVNCEMIVITGNATLNSAIDSIKLGVKDFFQKPFDPTLLLEAIHRSKKIQEFQKTHTRTTSKNIAKINKKNPFIATSPSLEDLKNKVLKVAKTDSSILLMGESGVGKEVFARFIYENSNRSEKPFVAINMAAIPEHLLESELFGYEKGAFTDALNQKPGLFELANGGTLFLDEIGEMPLMLQSKLLRALQEREVMRLGGSKTISFDVRIISATNANIESKIAKNEFREDLFYRLNTIPLKIPPLKERKEEILPIAQWKLESVINQYSLESKKFSKSAESMLLNYEWYGNIRELLSVVERAAILSDGELIEDGDLFLESRGAKSGNEKIEALEYELLNEAIKKYGRDFCEISKALGMSEDFLRAKVEKYKL